MKSPEKSVNFLKIILCFSIVFGLAQTVAWSQSESKGLGQGLWRPVDERRVPERGRRLLTPQSYVVFKLNQSRLGSLLSELPLEFSTEARTKDVTIEVPMPDGSFSRFRIEDSPVLAPHLAADFPSWKSFQGYGIDDPTATARFDWTESGFHGYIFTSRGTIYIDPFQEKDRDNYFVYYKHEYGPDTGRFRCNVDEFASRLKASDFLSSPESIEFAHGANIRTYRIAIATTGEWARSNTMSTDPQTVRAAALAAMMTSVNRLDGIFRRELSVTLQLVNPAIINDATNIIFDDPATDPYNNTDEEAQLNINQMTIDTRVGSPNYDVGHLYGTGGGGVASAPSVCSAQQKAEGYSAREGIPGDPFTVDYVAHEVGHQFGGSHTYNNRDMGGACTTRSTMNAFEVASGSTIMSYVGICNLRNLQQFVDTGTPAFHIRSLTQMVTNIQDAGNGGSCGTAAGTNSIPTVNAGANFTIPRLTPFTLTASANDVDAGDAGNILYSWEEYDLAPSGSGQLGTPAMTYDVDTDGILRPLFRAYSPVASPSRTFPTMNFILNPAGNSPAGTNNPPLTYMGTHPNGLPGAVCAPMSECVIGENLPSLARTMNFRVAVRDRRGGTADAGMTVTTVNTTGPFRVTTQDNGVAWGAGSTQTVTWDVVGTDAAPIGVANVNILLSTDGGQTFPTTLLANTPNDGTEQITVPTTPTTQGRIRVEAVGNIFFDISNENFTIPAANGPAVNVSDAMAQESRSSGRGKVEGAGTIDFTISLAAASSQTVTVRVETNGITATEGSDFVAVDDVDVVFPPNTLTRIVTVPTIDDPADEPDETFSLDVVSVTNASVGDGQGIGTIIDNDPPATPTPTPTPTPMPGAGLEGDLAGRPTGDGVFRANDLAALQLFFSGEPFNQAFNEFQRADGAPYEVRGDGRLTAADVQLMRNYIAQLAVQQPAGGPTEPVAAPPLPRENGGTKGRALRIVGAQAVAGETVEVSIEMDAVGDETITSFTLDFDPAIFANPVVSLGKGVDRDTILTVNPTNVLAGQIGVLLDSNGGFGKHAMQNIEILSVRFSVAKEPVIGFSPLAFGNSLVGADMSDINARSLTTKYEDASIFISRHGRPLLGFRSESHFLGTDGFFPPLKARSLSPERRLLARV